jgi:hypothetical protein
MKAQDITVGMEVAYAAYGNPETHWHIGWLKRGIIVAPASNGRVAVQQVDRNTGLPEDEPITVSIRTRGVYAEWTAYTAEQEAAEAAAEARRAAEREYGEWFDKNRDELLAVLKACADIDVEPYYVGRNPYQNGFTIRLDREEVEVLIAALKAQNSIATAAVRELIG